MINDKLLPVIRKTGDGEMKELKPGQLMLVEGDDVNFDELYAGTSRGNTLINPRTIVKGDSEPDHVEGLEWFELGQNGQPKYDFPWISRNGNWVSSQLYEHRLSANSQSNMEVSELIDLPYFGLSGLEPAYFVEEMRVTIVSEVEAEEPMGHNLISVGVGGLDVFNDDNAIDNTVQGSQMTGPSLRRSFDRGEVVTIADHPVFGLRARSAAGSDAFSSIAGAMAYRLVRELPEEPEEPEEPEAPAEVG